VAGDDGDLAPRRYRLLETVRLYAAAKLAEAGEDELIRDAHRDLYLEWLESFPPEIAYLDLEGKVRMERHNLRAALRWSEQQGRIDLVGRLAAQMNAIWITDIREGRRWTMLALEALDELDQPGRVRVLTAAAVQALLAMEAADGTLARRAVEASEGRGGVWSSLAHALLCLNAGIHYFLGRQQVYADEVEELGRKALLLAPGEFNRAMAWQFLGQARVLTSDLDGAIEGLAKGSVAAVESGDLGRISLAMLAGVLHVAGRDDEAFETAQRVVDSSSIKTSDGQWAWALYSALPYAIALGQRGRYAEALAFVRDLIDENATPRTPGVMSSVIITLGAMAQQRGDLTVAGPLLEYSTAALLRDGVRTPVDIAILMHYTAKMQAEVSPQDAQRYRDLAATMSTNDAIELGLRQALVG
jgi:tetratricopeptide (TPR) repeat protein